MCGRVGLGIFQPIPLPHFNSLQPPRPLISILCNHSAPSLQFSTTILLPHFNSLQPPHPLISILCNLAALSFQFSTTIPLPHINSLPPPCLLISFIVVHLPMPSIFDYLVSCNQPTLFNKTWLPATLKKITPPLKQIQNSKVFG